MFTFFLKAIRRARMAVKKRIRPGAELHGPPPITATSERPGYIDSEAAVIDAHSARFLGTPQLTLANLVGRAPTMAIAVDDKDSHTSQRCGYGTEGYLRSAEELSLAGSVAVSVSYIDGWNHDDHVEEGDNKHYTISERVSVMSSDHGIAKGDIDSNGPVEAHSISEDRNTDSDQSDLLSTPLSPLFGFPATHLDRDTKTGHFDATIPDHLLAPPLKEPLVSSKGEPASVEAFAGEIARWLGKYNEAHRDDGAQERLSQRHGQEDGMDATPETETKMTTDNDETMEEAVSQLATEALMASCPWLDEDTAWRAYMAALFEQLHMHAGKAEHLAEGSEVDGLLEGKIEATARNEASESSASKTGQKRSFKKTLEEYRARRMARLKRREEQDKAFRLRMGVIKEAAKAHCALDLMSFAIWEKQTDAWRAWRKEVEEKAGRISPRPPLMEMVLEDHVQSEDEKYRYEEDGHWF